MTTTVIKIGNSSGVILPAKLLKSLSFSEKDKLEMIPCNSGLLLRKVDCAEPYNVFSDLDKWEDENGCVCRDPVREASDYVQKIKALRSNKTIPEL